MKRPLRLQIILFIFVRIVFNTAIRIVYPFLPVLGRGLGVDLSTMSKALALRSATGVVGPMLASIADTRGRRAGMLLGLSLFILGNSLIFFFPNFYMFVCTILLTTLGYFVFNPSMQAFFGDKVSYLQRGRVLALTELGWSLSFIIGIPLIGFLIARRGWQAPFPFFAIMGLVSFVILFYHLPAERETQGNQSGFRHTFARVLTSKAALIGMLMGAAMSMANELLMLIYGVWLEDSFGLRISALGITAAVIGFSELGGELLSAGLVDRLGKFRAVSSGLVLNSLAVFVLVGLAGNLPGVLTGLFLFSLTFEFAIVCCIPLMTEIVPEARAVLMAVFIATMSLGRAAGDLLSPWLFQLGRKPGEAGDLLAIAIAVAALNFIAFFALSMMRSKIVVKVV